MDLATFARVLLAQALLHGIAWALQNLASLQIPFAPIVLPILAAALNAAAAWVRATLGPLARRETPFWARVF